MYLQQTTHNYHDPDLPIRVNADEHADQVSIHLGQVSTVYLALTADEARRVVDGITTALAVIDARTAEVAVAS